MAIKPFLNRQMYVGTLRDNLYGTDTVYTRAMRTGSQAMPLNLGHKRSKNGQYLEGGPWYMFRDTVTHKESGRVNASWYSGRYVYTGVMNADPPPAENIIWPSFDVHMNSLFAEGANALNKMNPVKPVFTAASSLFELREAPGMLKDAVNGIRQAIKDYQRKRAGRDLKFSGTTGLSRTAQWHLAVQFGWLPVLSDIRNFQKAQTERDHKLRQVIRDAERPVRRSKEISSTSAETSIGWNQNHGTPYNPRMTPTFVAAAYGSGNARTEGKRVHVDRIWAEGRCRYYLPPGPRNTGWTRKMRRRLMGGRVTPDAIWAVMPWSWLLDYFVDVGDFIKATGNGVADLLIWDYAYIMRTRMYTTTVTTNCYMMHNGKSTQFTASSVREQGFKCRVKASPFGFVKMPDLNARQLWILGALGFSKLP